jgi:hypothetical protein
MATEPALFDTTLDIEGFERNITVTLWYNEIDMSVAIVDKIVLTDTDQSLDFLLSDEELIEHLSERIAEEAEEARNEAELERALSYMDEY